MTLENQALHLDNERLEIEVAGLKAEVERLKQDYDRDMSAANETLVETLAERDEARAEVAKLRQACERLGDEVTRVTGECVRREAEIGFLRETLTSARGSMCWAEASLSMADRDDSAEIVSRDVDRLDAAMDASAARLADPATAGEGGGA